MIIRQLLDYDTNTYTYLLGDQASGQALLIDPVKSRIDNYLRLLRELDLTLVYALDTHIHADHVTALGELRQRTGAQTYLSNAGAVACSDNALHDGQIIALGAKRLVVMYTPGHTDDSYCFYLREGDNGYVFTGDTLLIRGSGRTDFQNGSAAALYDSLHRKLMQLPDATIVYPGHDYRGFTQSTIGEEKRHNPRLQIVDRGAFIEFMGKLNLPDPQFMDVAVPANRACGRSALEE